MHHVTTHGAHKITMDSKERDYQERLRQAKAQGDGNPSVMGVQAPEAQTSNIQNAPTEPIVNKTADADIGTSMTKTVQENPDQFQTDALDKRLAMYTEAASNAGYSLNDRSSTGSLR